MSQGGATYAAAGVDIAAGDAAVQRLRSMVAGIGGFGGQFPLDITRFKKPVLEVTWATLPMLGVLAIGVLLITYVPWLTLGLVHWMR